MSIWGLVALVALILMTIEGILGRGIRRSSNKLAQTLYMAGYLAVTVMVMLGILIDLSIIRKESPLIWLVPVLAVFALIVAIGGRLIDRRIDKS